MNQHSVMRRKPRRYRIKSRYDNNLADIVQFLYREDYYDKETEDRNMLEVIVAKHRDGPTGSIKLAFVREYGKVINIDWSSTDPKANEKGWSK